jgi:hypothetical protein
VDNGGIDGERISSPLASFTVAAGGCHDPSAVFFAAIHLVLKHDRLRPIGKHFDEILLSLPHDECITLSG